MDALINLLQDLKHVHTLLFQLKDRSFLCNLPYWVLASILLISQKFFSSGKTVSYTRIPYNPVLDKRLFKKERRTNIVRQFFIHLYNQHFNCTLQLVHVLQPPISFTLLLRHTGRVLTISEPIVTSVCSNS